MPLSISDSIYPLAHENGHYGWILVFSQFTSFLAMVRLRLDKQQQPYLYLDGSVPVRLHQTKRNLADAMLEETNESHKLTSKELLLRNIFRLSKKSLYLCTRSIKSSRL